MVLVAWIDQAAGKAVVGLILERCGLGTFFRPDWGMAEHLHVHACCFLFFFVLDGTAIS